MASNEDAREQLLRLSHELGHEPRRLAILGEGNTSARIPHDEFLVKASGASLATLTANDLVQCRTEPLLDLLDQSRAPDQAIDNALCSARVRSADPKPSVEALFHAYLLTLPDVKFVGHTHPVSVNQILCSDRARLFAKERLFPDEIVCCDIQSVLVPYADPGLRLAQSIRRGVTRCLESTGKCPRVILIENHGLIALGSTPKAVLAATLMAAKAAEVFVGAYSMGRRPRFLTAVQRRRIAGRPDEHHRQKALGLRQ